MLFDGWPAARLHPAPGRTLTALVALDRALAAYADSVRWTRATPNQWITTAALSFIGVGIVHVGIGLRWPFAPQDHGGEAMMSCEPSNPAVRRLVAAINDGDWHAFLATLTPDATTATRDQSTTGSTARSSPRTVT
jgi:hypothetical protein